MTTAADGRVLPLIGIAGAETQVSASLGLVKWHGVAAAYVRQVERAGAMPVVLPVLSHPTDAPYLCGALDGILLTGGGDIDPRLYEAVPIEEVYGVAPERDQFELALIESALDRDIPMLTICRGMQLLNVASGGSLIQHLGDATSRHLDVARWNGDVHEVRLAEDSLVRNVVQKARISVNSLHHQAIDRLGTKVRATAWADDDTIEAVEIDGRASVLGIQWHPELLPHDATQFAFFEWLIASARAQAK